MHDPSDQFFNILVFIVVARRKNVHFNLLNHFFYRFILQYPVFSIVFKLETDNKLTEYPLYVFFLHITIILY